MKQSRHRWPASLALIGMGWGVCAPPSMAADAVRWVRHERLLELTNGKLALSVDLHDGSLRRIGQCDGSQHCHELGATAAKAADEEHGDDFANDPRQAMYWDANAEVAHLPAGATAPAKGYFRPGEGEAKVEVVRQSPALVDVRVRVPATALFPLQVDYHYVLQRGQSGYHVYAVVHHTAQAPALTFYQTRFVVKTVMDGTFDRWALGPDQFVALPSARVVQKVSDATFRLADGSIKTKYMNSIYWSATPLYGYVGPQRGLWVMEASPEYHNGGPAKQGQAVHDNALLRVLQSVHFGASPVQLADGEVWSKVYGPFFVYANRGDTPAALWRDAAQQLQKQRAQWPYAWVDDPAYVQQRTTVSGKVELGGHAARDAWVILSDPNVAWSAQSKGYAFWARTDNHGRYTLENVIPGRYQLSVSGADQPHDWIRQDVQVTAGKPEVLATIHWQPQAHGRQQWQIGRFDRSAAEFRNGDNARQFQMYRHYPEQFPHDVDYRVGHSDPARDWNYAQWSIYSERPDWRIHFPLDTVQQGQATLTLGFASSQPAHGRATDLRVRVNGTEVAAIHLPKTGTAGYRGGTQDSSYNVREIVFPQSLLKPGDNVVSLAHADAERHDVFERANAAQTDNPVNPGQVMYDAIRLELSSADAAPAAHS